MECWNKCSRLSRWRRNHEISLLSMIVINRGYEGGVRDSAYRMRQRGREGTKMRQVKLTGLTIAKKTTGASVAFDLRTLKLVSSLFMGYAIRMLRWFFLCLWTYAARKSRSSAYAEEIRPIVSAEAGKGKAAEADEEEEGRRKTHSWSGSLRSEERRKSPSLARLTSS